MSALQFKPAQRKGEGFSAKACQVPDCNSSGRHRASIMGHSIGLVCTKHKNEMVRSWDACLDAQGKSEAA